MLVPRCLSIRGSKQPPVCMVVIIPSLRCPPASGAHSRTGVFEGAAARLGEPQARADDVFLPGRPSWRPGSRMIDPPWTRMPARPIGTGSRRAPRSARGLSRPPDPWPSGTMHLRMPRSRSSCRRARLALDDSRRPTSGVALYVAGRSTWTWLSIRPGIGRSYLRASTTTIRRADTLSLGSVAAGGDLACLPYRKKKKMPSPGGERAPRASRVTILSMFTIAVRTGRHPSSAQAVLAGEILRGQSRPTRH
jgi:hypothetical protein